MQTPNADDTLAIKPAAADSIQISGVSGAVALSPVTLTNVSTVIVDAATNDRDGGNDSLTIHAEGGLPGGIGFLEYQSGVGTNTLAVHDGLVRIDATVAEGGLLNTTVGPGAGLVTHRLRQNELVLADDARATILSTGRSCHWRNLHGGQRASNLAWTERLRN